MSEEKAEAAKNTMRVELTRTGTMAFKATSDDGIEVIVDGPAKYGGEGRGMRPMQLFLVSLAGCSSIDVVLILKKQKQRIDDHKVIVTGTRSDAIPSVYEKVHLAFELKGEILDKKLQRAVGLAVEKYCSVASMLLPEVVVTWEAKLVE